jgi:hypothetical protein
MTSCAAEHGLRATLPPEPGPIVSKFDFSAICHGVTSGLDACRRGSVKGIAVSRAAVQFVEEAGKKKCQEWGQDMP